MTAIDAYPLDWPPQWPREHNPKRSPFGVTLTRARDGLVRELQLLGARNIVINCNAELNRDGTISARQRRLEDTGAVAYFTLKGETRAIACDKWIELAGNIRALELMVGALRGLERWGGRQMVDQVFTGFAALPAGGNATGWWTVLGIGPDADRETIDRAYRQLSRIRHPDTATGSPAVFRELQQAYEQAKAVRP